VGSPTIPPYFLRRRQYVCRDIPAFRRTSSTAVPSPAWRKLNAIRRSLKFDRVIRSSSVRRQSLTEKFLSHDGPVFRKPVSVRSSRPSDYARSGGGGGAISLTGGGLAIESHPVWRAFAVGKAALRSCGLSLHEALRSETIAVSVVAVCGVVDPCGPVSPASVSDPYLSLAQRKVEEPPREIVFLPERADPFYNDPNGVYRETYRPIVGNWCGEQALRECLESQALGRRNPRPLGRPHAAKRPGPRRRPFHP